VQRLHFPTIGVLALMTPSVDPSSPARWIWAPSMITVAAVAPLVPSSNCHRSYDPRILERPDLDYPQIGQRVTATARTNTNSTPTTTAPAATATQLRPPNRGQLPHPDEPAADDAAGWADGAARSDVDIQENDEGLPGFLRLAAAHFRQRGSSVASTPKWSLAQTSSTGWSKTLRQSATRNVGIPSSLRNANLTGASLRDPDLRSADLRGACLGGADLTGTTIAVPAGALVTGTPLPTGQLATSCS
jgi:hypothetical protein